MATTEEGKIDIGKLQLKLFAGPNGINVLNLVPGKSPTFPSKPQSSKFNYEDTQESEAKRHVLPTVKLDIPLNESDDDKPDEEKKEDIVLPSLCKRRPKKPGAKPPSRTFVKKLGSNSDNEKVTLLIDTNTGNPCVNIIEGSLNEGELDTKSNINRISPSSNNERSYPSPVQHNVHINTFPPVRHNDENTEKKLNITLIAQAIQDRNLKKKENDSFNTENDTAVDSTSNINLLKIVDKPNDRIKLKKIIDDAHPPPIIDTEGQKTGTCSDVPKPSCLKKVHAVVNDQEIIKPSAIAKDQKNIKPFAIAKDQKNIKPPATAKKQKILIPSAIAKDQKIIKPPANAKDQRNTRNVEIKEQQKELNTLQPKEEIAKTKTVVSTDEYISKNIHEQSIKKDIEKTKDETSKANTSEKMKKVSMEIKGNKIIDKTTNECVNDVNVDDPSLRSRNTRFLKKPENNSVSRNEYALDRTQSEGSKAPKSKVKIDRSQSDIPKLKKDLGSSKTQKEEEQLSNKTYLELETLKNLNQKVNEKPLQLNEKLLNASKLQTQRSIGSIENVSMKRYQCIETSDYFNYKKSTDDVRLNEENDKITDNAKDESSDLFKSKADVLKDARTRERGNANTKTEDKSNVMYVPYSAGKTTNTDNITLPIEYHRSKSAGARSNEASLLPRFKGTSAATTSSVITKHNTAKQRTSFPSR